MVPLRLEKLLLSRDPTFLGQVSLVTGSALSVQLAESVSSGLSVIDGRTYSVGQVGSFVRVPQGYQDLLGVVSEVGANAAPEHVVEVANTGRWMRVELIGEFVRGAFERGVSRHPNIGDSVHLATDEQLRGVYGRPSEGYVTIGRLASAEGIPAKIGLDKLVTRHAAVLGSTGSGKSTTIVSLLRSITQGVGTQSGYPNARALLIDVHGEYSGPLADVAQVFSAEPQTGQEQLFVPYWALSTRDLLEFLVGRLEGNPEAAFTDKVLALKKASQQAKESPGVRRDLMTVDTPVPFSLSKLWYDLIDFEIATFEGENRDEPALLEEGDAETLRPPKYRPHAMGAAGPFLNPRVLGIRRQLDLLRSRMLDRRFRFLLHPGPWTPSPDGVPVQDIDELLRSWVGGDQPITVLDLSGVPSAVLELLIGAILKIVYDALFWGRKNSEGGVNRPLLVVMEEAHRYLGKGLAADVVQRIAKEGRKYGIGAMVVSQRPSEVDETVLSQCGTLVALRLSNPMDRARVQSTLPDGLSGLLDVLPILRTGEAIVVGEAATLPMRCRVSLPRPEHRPESQDPKVSAKWALPRNEGGYSEIVECWRAQTPRGADAGLGVGSSAVTEE